MNFQEGFIRQTISRLALLKKTTETAIQQVPMESLFIAPAEGSNSLAIIMQHMAGNMISRWTDFLASDGEKDWRKRDLEFELQTTDAAIIMEKWQQGWDCFLSALTQLTPADLDKKVTIRGEEHYAYDAILRQIMHYSQHMGQIIYLAKWLAKDKWEPLTIAKGESENFNLHMQRSNDENDISN